MSWNAALEFTRGPLFQVALIVFVGGMVYRLVRVVLLGWSIPGNPLRTGRLVGVGGSFAKGLIVLPFIPSLSTTFNRNPVTYLAGGLFHLGLFVVMFFFVPHVLVWKSLLGFGWPAMPLPIVDWFAAVSIVAMVALLINRLVDPVLKLLSGPSTWVNWSVVFLPLVTGYALTHHLFFRYEALFTVHMLTVNMLLIWIPFSRISHFMFYFFSRTFRGTRFGGRVANARGN